MRIRMVKARYEGEGVWQVRKNRRGVRYLAVLLTLAVMTWAAEPAAAVSVSDLEREKQELERQRREADARRQQEQQNYNKAAGKADSIQSDANEVAEEIDEIDAALVETIASVEMIEEEIGEKEEQIEETSRECEEAMAVEQQQYEAMKLRIKFMYEKGDSTYLEILLSGKSFSDIINKVEYVERLYEYDRNMLERYQEAREAVEALKARLEEERAELEAQQHELEEEKESLEIILDEKQAQYDNYEVLLAQARQEAAVYKANIKKQNEAIRKLESEAADKQSQIEEARRLEEEARKAQELALQRQAEMEAAQREASQNDSEDSGADSSENSSSSSSGSSQSDSGSSSSSGYASASSYSGSGGKGQQIANYACQFIGNPYVPGGTSLTQGADCSGFVWRVYQDFGYSVPRTSYSLRSSGSGVSYSEAQPGDVICYAGHVGIYIGNGQIVHASTQRSGIKITNATYKEILSVRRIV